MALKSRTYECPECTEQFTVLMGDTDPPPDYCPKCGLYVGAEVTVLPSAFKIGSEKTRRTDDVYRQMESSSVARAEAAAQMLGVSASETASLKLTDMNDNMREGDSAAIVRPVAASAPSPIPIGNAPVSDGSGIVRGAQFSGLAQQFTQGVKSGGGSAGIPVSEKLVRGHTARAAQMQQAGQMGSHKV